MTDLPTRLRRWTHDVDAVPASDLMDEAAAEIERLRWRVMTLESAARWAERRPTLTDEEREAVVGAIDVLEQEDQWHAIGERRIATLRGLLERMK